MKRWLLIYDVILRLDLFTVLSGDLSVDTHALQNIFILLGKILIFHTTAIHELNIERFKNYIKVYRETEYLI